MNIKPIKTETDYQGAMNEISQLFDAEPNTTEGDKLEILTTLVQVYEEEHYPIDFPDAVDALNYWMESRGLQRKDLQVFIGTRARISEILNRKRELTLAMIRKLNEGLKIPAELLIKKTNSTIYHKHAH
ncbi:DNA-binding protein [Legionella antarctica]|uniref:DNA-binding protein n=1 Tax=Legionella antarctica TaxID=2708020 RepID=A0A6F8T0S3_9GAMM|nr:helix-turn-helix domain-containing protein [Legionella antarctica]BCA93760.1 DNA-binding protein [Legionella antarctica]